MTRRPLFYGLCLLVGSLLFGIAGLNHPLLSGEGAAQLATVARTSAWRLIHWSLLFGLAFMYTGLVGVALRHTDTAGAPPARAGVAVGAFAFSVWSINILFMVGAGWQLAQAYMASDAGLTGTHAVFVYDMLHPMGLAAERLATFMLGLVAYMFGWTIRNGAIWPKWLAWMAWGVAGGGGGPGGRVYRVSPQPFFVPAVVGLWPGGTPRALPAERRPPPTGPLNSAVP